MAREIGSIIREFHRADLPAVKALVQDRGGTIHVEVGGKVVLIAQGRLL